MSKRDRVQEEPGIPTVNTDEAEIASNPDGSEGPPMQGEIAQEYDMHVKLDNEMRLKLKDAAQLAYRMGNITKPDLADLIELVTGYGMAVLKQQWLGQVGYR